LNAETLKPCNRDPRRQLDVPLSSLRRIDGCCEQFEQSFRRGQPTMIEDCLAQCSEDQALLFRELLAIELEYRSRRGDSLAPSEYLRRFPQFESVVALAFGEAEPQPCNSPAFLANHSRYRVLGLLGSGGMGTVYLAKHLALDRDVALKVIRPDLLSRSEVVERFRGEAKSAASLNHPNIVAVFDAETAADRHMLVMEYIAGADLFRLVQERGLLAIAIACDYIRQAALGLQHAHEHGMVHRDISPRNLMLAADGQVKVLDFGLAQFVQDGASGHRAGETNMLLGSVDFMAPEQAADPRRADIRADIYSLGCTFWFLLTGQSPFSGGTMAEKLRRHAEENPARLDQVRPDVPARLADTVARMLRKRPADRFAAPAEIAEALVEFCGNEGGPTRTRRRAMVAVAVALLVLIATAIVGRNFLFRTADVPAAQGAAEAAEPWRLYREGLHLLSLRKEQQVHAAIGRLEKAVELAPRFALAQTALADAYNLCGDYGWDFPDDVFPKARQAAQRALAQDDRLAEAHLALAFVLHAYACDWATAETEYRRALALNPRLPAAHHWYAWFLAERGRPPEAAEQIRMAHELAPDDLIIVNNVGKLLYFAHDFAGAVERHKYALELDPDFRKAHRDLGLADAELGEWDNALSEFEKSRGLTDDDRDVLGAKAYVLARNGHAKEARALLAQLEPLSAGKPVAYDIAAIYAALGEPAEAFQWLTRAVATHVSARSGLGVDPRFDALHSDARWQPLLRKIGSKAAKS
jgi:tetratricopeptide (TPR) repeat protein/tRNA A-37 threonylcarbamoyl transferase component Bud32